MTDLALIGEAWGESEERERLPFIGAAGYELTRMLEEAGIHRADCFLSNVFNLRPAGNKIETLCGDKSSAIAGFPALVKGRYIHATYARELDRLGDELLAVNPNLVVCLGNTAMWAMLGKTAISKLRGTTSTSTHTASGFKVLPTYHPAAVLRQWELRPVTVIDLIKAKRESAYAEIRRPSRQIWIEPTLDDIILFRNNHINPSRCLSVDIETAGNAITCIGFSPHPTLAIVIPFLDSRKLGRSYWPTKGAELSAWGIVRDILSTPRPKKVFQNGIFDMSFLWRAYGIKVMGAEEDTLLLHHALQPESLKSLGFLGSIYTDEGSWKDMRGRTRTIKADE